MKIPVCRIFWYWSEIFGTAMHGTTLPEAVFSSVHISVQQMPFSSHGHDGHACGFDEGPP